MSNQNLLMIFVRNARIGQVKTRLASTIGDENALKVYIHLLNYTAGITEKCDAHKAVFYSDIIEEADEFMVPVFRKYLQYGKDLGERMMNAFLKAFAMGYTNVVIIGSDCVELNESILNDAFAKLEHNDVVIGPAADGGYYLLGMKKFIKELFREKEWSTDNVLLDTLLDIKKQGVAYAMLPTLNDIDEEKDLGELKSLIE
jgi:uncharacterized protein